MARREWSIGMKSENMIKTTTQHNQTKNYHIYLLTPHTPPPKKNTHRHNVSGTALSLLGLTLQWLRKQSTERNIVERKALYHEKQSHIVTISHLLSQLTCTCLGNPSQRLRGNRVPCLLTEVWDPKLQLTNHKHYFLLQSTDYFKFRNDGSSSPPILQCWILWHRHVTNTLFRLSTFHLTAKSV